MEYGRLTSEPSPTRSVHHANQRTPADLTMAELCERFHDHAQRYYVKLGKLTSEIHTVRKMVKTVRTLYGHVLVGDFGPLALKVCRQQWIEEGVTRQIQAGRPREGDP
jgi:hypothetical protein